jgi:hypothetical protein
MYGLTIWISFTEEADEYQSVELLAAMRDRMTTYITAPHCASKT